MVSHETYHCHIRLHAAQRPRSCYRRQILAKRRRVQRVAEGEQGRQALERTVMETIEVCEIARLVDFVDVCLFGREMDVLANFVADIAEERIVDEIVNYGVLVAMT